MTIGSMFSGIWSWVKDTVLLKEPVTNKSDEGTNDDIDNIKPPHTTNQENNHSEEGIPPSTQESLSIETKDLEESPSKITSQEENLSPLETSTLVRDTSDGEDKDKTYLTNISDIKNTMTKTLEELSGPYAYAGKWKTEHSDPTNSSNKINDSDIGKEIGESKEQSIRFESENTPVNDSKEVKIKQNFFENNEKINLTTSSPKNINYNKNFYKNKNNRVNNFIGPKNFILESSNVKNSVLHETAYDLARGPRERLKKTIYEKYGLVLKSGPDSSKLDLKSNSPEEAQKGAKDVLEENLKIQLENNRNNIKNRFDKSKIFKFSKPDGTFIRNKFDKYDSQRYHRDIQFPSNNFVRQTAQNQSSSLQQGKLK